VNILIVEDDLKLLRLYAKILKNEGHNIRQAATISAARSLMARHSFDLCIMDMHIGYHSSGEMIPHFPTLKQSGTQLIVISGQDRHRNICETLGAEYYLKPVSKSKLVEIVEDKKPAYNL